MVDPHSLSPSVPQLPSPDSESDSAIARRSSSPSVAPQRSTSPTTTPGSSSWSAYHAPSQTLVESSTTPGASTVRSADGSLESIIAEEWSKRSPGTKERFLRAVGSQSGTVDSSVRVGPLSEAEQDRSEAAVERRAHDTVEGDEASRNG
ncbi:hypothetical protein JCM10212_006866 [Sporobolomyces blumeae]